MERDEILSCDKITFGGIELDADQFVEMCQKGNLWRDVQILSEIYAENTAALLYERTDTVTGQRIRVGEFIRIENGLVKGSLASFGSGTPPSQ